MEVKPAYKQTEVGVIPDVWNHRPFGHLYAEPSRNGIYKPSEFQGRGTRIVNMGEMFGFEFISDQDMSRVELTPRELSQSGLQDGDLLFGRRSVVPSGAGKCSLVVSPDEPITFESSIIRVRLSTARAHSRFYYYFFASPTGRSTVGTIVSGTNVKGIRASELRELEVPVPPVPEQEAIAEALSDADALIESLQQLLTKKRHLKQGAMQELLTGKKRPPGFSGKWEVKRLGDVASLYQPTTISAKQFAESGYPVYGANGVVGFYSQLNHETWQVTVTCRGSTCGTVNRTMDRCWITGNAMVLNCDQNQQLNKEFFYHLLCNQDLADCITGTGQPQIVRAPLAAFEVSLPPTIAEQSAIAAILSDLDTEIAALQAKLAKARQIKQGMMQELLTGRIRLL